MDAGSQTDYISNIPPEILEIIWRQIDGKDVVRLKKSAKIFNFRLENPIAWRSIFNAQFKREIINSKYNNDCMVNWREEVDRLLTFKKAKRKSKLGLVARSSLSDIRSKMSVRMYKNHLLIDGYAPLDIKSCVKKKGVNFIPRYAGYIAIGPYAGQVDADNWGGHKIIDQFTEEIPFVLKTVYHTQKTSKLISFNSHLAVLSHGDNVSIWNLSITCKHTDEKLWKKSKKHGESCETCACVGHIHPDSERPNLEGVCCSQIDPKMIFIPSRTSLQLRWPIEGRSIDIQFDDTCQIKVDSCPVPPPGPTYAAVYQYYPNVKGEMEIEIDGALHHIVHCVVNKRHCFYDVTTQKLMAAIDCWYFDKWIPNSCYFAMATATDVIVVDIQHKIVVSQFCPKIERLVHGRPVTDPIYGLEASSYSPMLIVGMTTLVICSALTGAQFEVSAQNGWGNMVLSEDEKTLIVSVNWRVCFLDLGNTLSSLRDSKDSRCNKALPCK